MGTKKRKPYRLLQAWEAQAVVDAYNNGEKLAAIAAEFDVHESTIILRAKKYGLVMRGSGRKLDPDVAYRELLKKAKTIPPSSPEFQVARRFLGRARDANAKKRQQAKAG